VQAADRLGFRAILLTPHRSQIPANLPQNVRHFDYLPFSRILPRAAAFVHHGGIGSVAQALKAGVPQLIVPWGIVQFDNAARVEALGVGRKLRLQTITAERLGGELTGLLGSHAIRSRCNEVASLMRKSDPLNDTCLLIESLAREKGLPA
jgi:rhamnosyltransferase subunit B